MSNGQAREGFDLDLEYGQERERILEQILTSDKDNVYIECKSDEKAKETGNVYVEYQQKDEDDEWKNSGIAVTEADYWAEEVRENTWVIKPIEKMKDMVRKAIKSDTCKVVTGGDYNGTKGVLIPEEWLIKGGN